MNARDASLRTLALVGACLAPLAAGAQERIEVFVVGDQRVAGAAGASAIYHIDMLAKQVEAMSAGLPADPERASAIAKVRFENMGDADRSRLHRGAEIETLARQYRLTKAPAMVVDGRAVIYGVNDVEHARAIYRAWRARKGG